MAMKYSSEIAYWVRRFIAGKQHFPNAHYQAIMLAMAEEADDSFMRGKIVADFGCGPRGSLVWTKAPAMRFGIDVLSGHYFNLFGAEMIAHGYPYITSTEKYIPMPSESVDIIFTMNALDHVDDFSKMSSEILRIVKPGGMFIGSFNLNEDPTACEPQILTHDIVMQCFSKHLRAMSCRTALKDPQDTYKNFLCNNYISNNTNEKAIIWLKGYKAA